MFVLGITHGKGVLSSSSSSSSSSSFSPSSSENDFKVIESHMLNVSKHLDVGRGLQNHGSYLLCTVVVMDGYVGVSWVG